MTFLAFYNFMTSWAGIIAIILIVSSAVNGWVADLFVGEPRSRLLDRAEDYGYLSLYFGVACLAMIGIRLVAWLVFS